MLNDVVMEPVITTGRAQRSKDNNNGGGGGVARKLLTKAAHHKFSVRSQSPTRTRTRASMMTRASVVICILILKIAATTTTSVTSAHVIPDIDGQIINPPDKGDTGTGRIGDLSISHPEPGRLQLNHSASSRPSNDAGLTTSSSVAGAGGAGGTGGMLGRAATYSYYYIGRKLLYVPLFFLLYWTVYNMWLLLESVASRWVSSQGTCPPGRSRDCNV